MAGEASADETDASQNGRANCSDILEPLGMRPILREHRSAERVLLHLPEHRPKPSPFEAELESTDAGKEGANHLRFAASTTPLSAVAALGSSEC